MGPPSETLSELQTWIPSRQWRAPLSLTSPPLDSGSGAGMTTTLHSETQTHPPVIPAKGDLCTTVLPVQAGIQVWGFPARNASHLRHAVSPQRELRKGLRKRVSRVGRSIRPLNSEQLHSVRLVAPRLGHRLQYDGRPRRSRAQRLSCSAGPERRLLSGGVAERLKAPVLKTGFSQGNVGSNPTPSARATRVEHDCRRLQ